MMSNTLKGEGKMKYADLSLSPNLELKMNYCGEVRTVRLNRLSAQVLAAAISEFCGPRRKVSR